MPARRHPPADTSVITAQGPRERALRTIRQWIDDGRLPVGEPLPSDRALAARLAIPYPTVRRAMLELASEGVVHGQRRQRRVRPSPATAPALLANTLLVCSDLDPALRTEPQPRDTGWSMSLVDGALQQVQHAGRHLLVVSLERSSTAHLARLAAAGPEGAAVIADRWAGNAAGLQRLQGVLAALRARHIPVAVLGYGDEFADCDRVCSDHAAGAAELTDWLLARGCRRILRVWWQEHEHDFQPPWLAARYAGHTRALQAAGVAPLPVLQFQSLPRPGDARVGFEYGVHALAGYLLPYVTGPQAVDAIMAPSDGETYEVAAACRLLGREPGRDLLITGYDNYWQECPVPTATPPGLAATVDKHNLRLGQELVRLLLDRIAGNLPPTPVLRQVPQRLVVVP